MPADGDAAMQRVTATADQSPRLRVVMAGPLPPLIGGMTTVIEDLSKSELAHAVDLRLFDTSKITPEGRSFLQAVSARLTLWRRWWTAMADADIAHIHTCSGLSFFLDGAYAVLARMRGVPTVLHVHGGRFDTFLDELSPPARMAAQWIARTASRVIVLSDGWRDRLATRLPRASLSVVENGVAVPARFTAHPAKPGKVTAAFLANLAKPKGVWDLLDAAPQLDPSVHVVMIGGEGEPGIAAQLAKAIAARGLQDRITLAGPAKGEERFQRLAEATLFVLPSHLEGLPMSLLEAMAIGLPCIVTPVGAIPSVIENGRNGVIVPVGDAATLGREINALARDPERRARLGAAARADCVTRFGLAGTVEKIRRIYDDVARRRPSGKPRWADA
jgi:glycosyltransferase involved in cell wall biosynthesis